MRQSVYKDILKFLVDIQPVSPRGHSLSRLQVMASLVSSCVFSKRSTLESLSAGCGAGVASKKNSFLQRTKRWLGNKWVDWDMCFLPLAKHFLSLAAGQGELIFVMDGTQTGKQHTCLMVSALCRGFAIPVAWALRKGEKGHFPEEMHLNLLDMLSRAVPKGCRSVLLGDGEFDGAGLRAWCFEQNWEFVVRTARDRLVDCGGEHAPLGSLAPPKGHRTFFVPAALDDGSNALCWHEKRFEKPIFLLTNLDLASMACHYYRRRFKIETMFKHLKSKGFQLHKTQLLDAAKISNLVIVVATAFIFTYWLGCALKRKATVEQLEKFIRKDKLPNVGFILLAQRAWEEAQMLAIRFFSDLSKNSEWVFS